MKRSLIVATVFRGGVTVAPPTVNSVTVTGTRRVGETLTATIDATDEDSLSYQWYRYATPIDGATSSTYTLVSADADQAIVCRGTATNAGGSASAYSAWDTYTVPKTFDWTGASNTTTGVVGQVGTTSVGINGWTPKVSSVWQIVSGKAKTASASGSGALYANILYLGNRARLNDRVLIQGSGQSAPLYYTGGVGFNTTTGEGYMFNWTQANRSATLYRMLASDGTYAAESRLSLLLTLVSGSYASGAADDWLSLERYVLGETSYLTLSIYPNASGIPDEANVRATYSAVDTYAALAVPGYAYVSSCVSGYLVEIPRFEVTSRTFDFVTASVRYGLSQSVDIALTGTNTQWTSASVFTATTGLTINSITATDTTHVTLHCTAGSALADVTITEPGGATQRIYLRTDPTAETRQMYSVKRTADVRKTPVSNGAGAAVFASSAAAYGVGFSADGQYVYVLNQTSPIQKYNLAGTLQTTISYTGISARKMINLPNGDLLVNNWGGDYQLISGDADAGVWNKSAGGGSGMALLYDQVLARNTVLTVSYVSGKVHQWETNGTLIKEWASPGGALADVVVDSAGYVYISDWTETPAPAPKILRYTNQGVYVATITTALSEPFDMCIWRDDTIIAACEFGTYTGRLRGFTPFGADLGDWQNPGAAVVGVGISPV